MASEKTPNLGLNQIDRTSPKTTYFDLEKYLDQNWRAVDDFAGDVNDGVNEIKKRLDTTERKAVTLEPGVQILNAVKAAPFSLSGITGRMLVNLLGRAGSGDQIGSLLGWEADLAVDTSNKAQGAGSIKVTAKNATGVYNVYSSGLKLTGGRYYIALADVKNVNASNNIYVNFSTGGNKALKQSIDKSQFVTIYTKCAPANDTAINLEVSSISTATGQAFYADAIRLYEISASEYVALDSMTAEQVAAKYPYVDSVMPVRNPYAIMYGENLLPSFYEWGLHANMKAAGPYSLSLAATASFQAANVYVPVVIGKAYTISGEVTGILYMAFEDANGNVVGGGNTTSTPLPLTFTAPANASRLRVTIDNGNTSTGTFTFSELMLNIGSTAKPFKPREDSMLALQTDLYADPVTGANADTVFERDGQYYKSKKWQGLTLDGNLAWIYFASGTGYKVVRIPVTNGVVDSERITKFDGKLIQHVFPLSGPDQSHLSPESGIVGLSISVADSGWADGYTPTQDEIKAYFLGWNMYYWNGTSAELYNNQGPKSWRKINNHGATTSTLPTTQIDPGLSKDGRFVYWEPYKLVYQLATPTVEPIVSEGQLTFNEGDNQVEVGTGIVLRERANPTKFSNVDINTGLTRGNATRHAVKSYLNLYQDNRAVQSGWGTFNGEDNGMAIAIYPSRYLPESAYSVTYFMLAPSPVVPFTGSYAANEKTLLSDLVDSVQQANTRLSVVENKKADKDSPAWFYPTLLNGWSANRPVGIMKDSNGFVHIRGLITNGLTTGGSALFTLPQGYRPISIQGPVSYGYGPSGPVFVPFDIFPDGRVCFGGGGAKDSTSVSLLFPPFIAEK
ncbi:hypothetical protein T3H97_05740 [Paenibacillus sp. LX16]|uniref:hypothetical protein n=1 Tax=Paenibacillus sp. LX16 TaxID=1740264 RepID=UPI002E28CEBA|nr:hypothetical protein [Paenibacillus sp. LX16]